MLQRIFAFLFLSITLTGCVSLNSVSLTQVPQERANQVTASADHWAILGIAFDNDFVDEAINDLRNQCQGGKLDGVLTKFQNTVYFLVVKREVVATAYCQKG
ncbi:MAG: hypothetical protein MK185_14145 [Saccharospirillaceae bacterium]|nr:hypothetical protein A3759_00705 [Thalassolituus sp. HI0120]MCH2041765.1 hypothetical protein [Saccharospirillaceae bacterium]